MFELLPWREKRDVQKFRRQLDDFFDRVFGAWPSHLTPWEGDWAPSVDVSETGKEVIVRAEAPGMDPKDIDISLVGNRLTIKGERKQEKEEKEENYYRSERIYGSFSRTVQLPAEVDENKIDATYKDGVLKITMPKTREEGVRKIEVKAG